MDPRTSTCTSKYRCLKWGRFLPHQRANVDQVPLPFVTAGTKSGCSSHPHRDTGVCAREAASLANRELTAESLTTVRP